MWSPLYRRARRRRQDRAIAPAPPGRRKVVLATSIAETSLTIEGVRVVVDSGLARVPRYEPDVGLTRLETVRVSRAAADQRRGRAGRTEPGVCYRLWDEPQTASLEPLDAGRKSSPPTSPASCSISPTGASPIRRRSPSSIRRRAPAVNGSAGALLRRLGAHRRATAASPTKAGSCAQLPLPPRLARMVVDAARRGRSRGSPPTSPRCSPSAGSAATTSTSTHRLDELRRDRSRRARGRAGDGAALGGHCERRRRSRRLPERAICRPASLLALAYPDRIAKNRGAGGAFLLANGRGANVDPASPLAREPFLAVAEIAGTAAQGRILLAAPLTLAEIEARFAGRIEAREEIAFDAASASLRARRAAPARRHRARRAADAGRAERRRPRACWPKASRASASIGCRGARRCGNGATASCSCAGRKATNGPTSPTPRSRRARPTGSAPRSPARPRLRIVGADELAGRRARHLLPWNLRRRLDAEAPTHFAAPSGSPVPIDYEAEEGPKLAIRVQELFGLDRHPAIAGGRVPLVVELLSPAHRPVQVTRDLPGFWRGSYAAVKAEMKGRYPRHPWPDDPLAAPPTRRAKPRGDVKRKSSFEFQRSVSSHRYQSACKSMPRRRSR